MTLKCDVLFLADVFKKIINNCLKNYGFCPSHCLSAPRLSWDAMPKMTKIKLELFPNPDILYFFKKVQELEFVIFLIDIAKPLINT